MNLDRIEAILRLLQQQGHVGELSAEGDGWRLRARKGFGIPPPPPTDLLLPAEELPGPERRRVTSTMVGIYRAPAEPLRPGDHVGQGTTVGSIESMRILNPITVEESGYLAEALVEDGDPVEYGQELFILAPEPD